LWWDAFSFLLGLFTTVPAGFDLVSRSGIGLARAEAAPRVKINAMTTAMDVHFFNMGLLVV
jgi:hypothetical protein